MSNLLKQMQELEERLLHTDYEAEPHVFDELLAAEFMEIAENGQRTTRAQVIEWLKNKKPEDHWQLSEFQLRMLSDNLVQFIYHARKINSPTPGSKGSVRSSLWQRNGEHWQILFNQGSKIS